MGGSSVRGRHLGWRVVALLLALTLVAAACGDDDGGDAAGDDPSPTDDGSDDGSDGGGEEQTVTVGVAWADLSQFIEVNPAFDTGDNEQQIQAILEGWRDEGLLPVNGVDVEFVTRSFNPIDDTDKQAVCQAFAQEDEVFAVLAGRVFGAGAECLAERFGIPVISSDAAQAEVYERTAPWLFTLRVDESRTARNFVAWADEEGEFDDKTIGLFWDVGSEPAVEALKAELSDRGHEIASEVETGGQGIGSEQDQVAVQRFQSDGVDLVLFMVGGTSVINFMSVAEEQGYRPGYLDWDFSEHMDDVAAAARPAEQVEGMRALALSRIGDIAAEEVAPESERCLSNYESFSGETLPREGAPTAEISNILILCSLGDVFIEALGEVAGGELTGEALVGALEGIEGLPVAYYEDITYSADDHGGAESQRPVVWDSECPCFMPDGDFQPLPI